MQRKLVGIDVIEKRLGSAYGRAVRSTNIGKYSPAVTSTYGYHIVQPLEKQSGAPIPFEQVRPRVLSRYRRHAAQQALLLYLKELREDADVWIPGNAMDRVRSASRRQVETKTGSSQ